MGLAMTARWDSPAALAVLLDALEADLLRAPNGDLGAALRETCRAKEGAIREIRSLLRDAEGRSENGYPLTLPFDEHDGWSTQRH